LSTGACALAIPAPTSITANADPTKSVLLKLPLFDMAYFLPLATVSEFAAYNTM
jgi:hypothetical protein